MKSHLRSRRGRTHTRVEYSVIMRAPLIEEYKRGKRGGTKGRNKIGGGINERKVRIEFGGFSELAQTSNG